MTRHVAIILTGFLVALFVLALGQGRKHPATTTEPLETLEKDRGGK